MFVGENIWDFAMIYQYFLEILVDKILAIPILSRDSADRFKLDPSSGLLIRLIEFYMFFNP